MKKSNILFALCVILTATGCSDEAEKPSSQTPSNPEGTVSILVDSQTDLTVTASRQLNLTWSALKVIEPCRVSGSDGSSFSYANKNATVTPTSSTTYTIECMKSDGKTPTSASTRVTISSSADVNGASGVVSLLVNGQPSVSLNASSSVNLSWTGTNVRADSCSVRGSDQSQYSYTAMSAVVTPTVSTTYLLNCTDNSGVQVSSSASVMIGGTTTTTGGGNGLIPTLIQFLPGLLQGIGIIK